MLPNPNPHQPKTAVDRVLMCRKANLDPPHSRNRQLNRLQTSAILLSRLIFLLVRVLIISTGKDKCIHHVKQKMLPPGLNLRGHHIRLSCDLQRQTEAQRHASNPPCGSENLCKISRVEHVYEMLLWHENVNWLHICCTYAFFGQ